MNRSLWAGLLVALTTAVWADGAPVNVLDGGPQVAAATWECTAGHKVQKHQITLSCGETRYGLLASGCLDPSHGEKRPCNEGTFGMPVPTSCNFYWGGFLQVKINGTDATAYRCREMRVLERGERGSFQILWAHPDAEVGLRVMLRSGDNHLLTQLVWRPRAGAVIKTVQVHVVCYPSFFTTSRHRQGDRHCRTPRTDLAQPKTLTLVPAQYSWLYYYDTIFDRAKGEGEGPCAMLVEPAAVAGGKVGIGDYAEVTDLDLKPEAGQARFGFYDFVGHTNAEAQSYLDAHGAEDLATLQTTDFRPAIVRNLQPGELQAEALRLLAAAAEDGQVLKPQVDKLLGQVTLLQQAAAGGDWTAEAELAGAILGSADLFWKLRAFAALNAP